MRKLLPFWLVIVLCAVALVASSILLVDYVRPAPVFCDAAGGCGIIKRTSFAYPLGIPTPLFGIGGFLAIGLAQLLPGRRARIAQAMLAVFGGIVAAGLLGVQAMLKTVCPFCAVADSAALLLFVLSVARALRGWDPPERRAQLAGGVLAVLAAVVVPIAIGATKKPIPVADLPGVPPPIVEELAKTPAGKVTVVDFVDFQCPFCRMTHSELAPLLAERKEKVRLVRKHVPLHMHEHAMDAARAACCGEKLGKGEEMAEALFTAPVEELTREGCEALAAKNGVDLARFRDCLQDPSIEARIHADGEAFRAAHGHGLPTIYVGATKLEGAQKGEVLRSTLDTAIQAL